MQPPVERSCARFVSHTAILPGFPDPPRMVRPGAGLPPSRFRLDRCRAAVGRERRNLSSVDSVTSQGPKDSGRLVRPGARSPVQPNASWGAGPLNHLKIDAKQSVSSSAFLWGFDLERSGVGGVMIDLETCPSTEPLLVTFVVRPEEIELAFATERDALRQRLMLAIVAALISAEPAQRRVN
jgi:hypothetical protein